MFGEISEKLDAALKKIRGHGKISEKNVSEALKDVRIALLEADVNYKVVKQFTEDVKAKALHLTTAPPAILEDLGRYSWFTVIRDPYSRTLSAFLDKFRREEFIRQFRAFEMTADGYLQFLYWLADGNLGANSHWNLQTRAMLMPLS